VSLGKEFQDLVSDMAVEDFGSLLSFKRVTRTESLATGEVTQTETTESFVGMVTTTEAFSPLFGESTLTASTVTVVVPQDQLSSAPTRDDEVALGASSTDYKRVVEVETYLGPNPAGDPVVIAYLLALQC
jgi:hypothetical protein